MAATTLTALKVGPSTTELREFPLPEVTPDSALLKMEVAGVCGTDVSQYKLPLRGAPLIMGHENVGTLAKVGREFEKHKGFKEGDLVFLEHYLPAGLYRRALIILVAPMVLLQTIMTGVILDRHWDNVTRVLARSLAREIGLIIELYDTSDKSQAALEHIEKLANRIQRCRGGRLGRCGCAASAP